MAYRRVAASDRPLDNVVESISKHGPTLRISDNPLLPGTFNCRIKRRQLAGFASPHDLSRNMKRVFEETYTSHLSPVSFPPLLWFQFSMSRVLKDGRYVRLYISSQNFEINSDFDWRVSDFCALLHVFFSWFLWELRVWDDTGNRYGICNFGLVFFFFHDTRWKRKVLSYGEIKLRIL